VNSSRRRRIPAGGIHFRRGFKKGNPPCGAGWEGDGGGTIVCAGTPEEVAACAGSYTGHYLKKLLEPT